MKLVATRRQMISFFMPTDNWGKLYCALQRARELILRTKIRKCGHTLSEPLPVTWGIKRKCLKEGKKSIEKQNDEDCETARRPGCEAD